MDNDFTGICLHFFMSYLIIIAIYFVFYIEACRGGGSDKEINSGIGKSDWEHEIIWFGLSVTSLHQTELRSLRMGFLVHVTEWQVERTVPVTQVSCRLCVRLED